MAKRKFELCGPIKALPAGTINAIRTLYRRFAVVIPFPERRHAR
jgi:hypothetical protein